MDTEGLELLGVETTEFWTRTTWGYTCPGPHAVTIDDLELTTEHPSELLSYVKATGGCGCVQVQELSATDKHPGVSQNASAEKKGGYESITIASYAPGVEVIPLNWSSIGTGTRTVQKPKKDLGYWKSRFWWRVHEYVSDKVGGCRDL